MRYLRSLTFNKLKRDMKQHEFTFTGHDFDLKTRFSLFLRASRPMIFYSMFYIYFLTQTEKETMRINKMKT